MPSKSLIDLCCAYICGATAETDPEEREKDELDFHDWVPESCCVGIKCLFEITACAAFGALVSCCSPVIGAGVGGGIGTVDAARRTDCGKEALNHCMIFCWPAPSKNKTTQVALLKSEYTPPNNVVHSG